MTTAVLPSNTVDDSASIEKSLRGSFEKTASSDDVTYEKRLWYRTPFFNLTILGLCNFAAPGIWGAMNSLGAGGAATPGKVNAANSVTFCLMVLSCFFGSTFVNAFGVRATLMFGTSGYAVYAAGLYTNSTKETAWFLLFGAACCGICAGLFWSIEAAIALSYPPPKDRGKALGYWLCFRVAGQVVGGAINLGLDARNAHAGHISPKAYIIFIVIQSLGPFIAWLISPPNKVQRKDGSKVELYVDSNILEELRQTAKMFFSKKFLLIVPLICQSVFSESFTGTFAVLHFSVRARALGSFVSAIICMIGGLIEGNILDKTSWSLQLRARVVFWGILTLQIGWWVYSTVIQSLYAKSGARDSPTLDWGSPGFGRGFALYLAITLGMQVNYLYVYFVVGSMVKHPRDIVRITALLRGTESAAQAVSYGLNSTTLSLVGSSAINFAICVISILPGWLVVRKLGSEDGFLIQPVFSKSRSTLPPSDIHR